MKRMMIMLVLILITTFIYGHSIEYSVFKGGIGIEFFYDAFTPVQNADVSIFRPDQSEVFQKGKTDVNGKFVFSPDQKGKWKIVLKDDTGHGLTQTIEVDDLGSIKVMRGSMPLWQKLLFGLSVIFGITGLLSGYYSRKRVA